MVVETIKNYLEIYKQEKNATIKNWVWLVNKYENFYLFFVKGIEIIPFFW